MVRNENKILLHACCAICSAYPISLLREMECEPIVYFCNPNISDEEEFNRRLDAQIVLCNHYNVELIVENYCNDYDGYSNNYAKRRRKEKGKSTFLHIVYYCFYLKRRSEYNFKNTPDKHGI